MKLSEFILLNEMEKQHTVLHEGVLIGKRKQHSFMIFLFQLGHYYVETWCNFSNKSVSEYRVFDGTAPLEPYLDQISLQQLFR